MEAVNKKQKIKIPFYLALLIILVVASLGFYWYLWQKINYDVDSSQPEIFVRLNYSPKTKNTKKQLISLLQSREREGKYGEWPLGTIILSDKRGNPFLPKIK
ncbi:hypothetical protein HZA71_01315 [Candidatus Falkowbacteria bacterium]|nr:hypothetical protein [Candidatus Falkowbacteria bacterium]